MQLLILILKKVELMNEVIKEVARCGATGGTVLEGTGIAKSLSNMEDLPIFGMLRKLTNTYESSKLLLLVLRDEEVMSVRNAIRKVVDLTIPNSGIMFSIPLTYVEGIGEKVGN